ncbi:MAG TPA: metallopeptidase family protein [Candidatus Dormibacteraeota bacterium]|jgi:predicted Zn-dependent protease with MMP-like domain
MPFRTWFGGRGVGLKEQVRQALDLARQGQADAAVATVSARFPEALDELRALDQPVDAAWLRLAAYFAFRSGQMADATAAAEQALGLEGDAETWHLLGRVRVWLDRHDAADAFRRARDLDPERFFLPYRVSRERFAALADAALAAIPPEFRAQMDNTMVVVDDLPELDAVREGEDPDVLGVYEGATAMDRGLPERIVLYQRNHEHVAATKADLEQEVTETMRHEIGHHFGMDEDELPY